MSGLLDVEQLLDSAAASKENAATSEQDDRHRGDRSEKRDRDRARDGSRDRDRDRKRRERSKDRSKNGGDDVKSPGSDLLLKNGGSRRHSRDRSRRDKRKESDENDDRRGDHYRGNGRPRSRSGSDDGDRHYRPPGRDRREVERPREKERDRDSHDRDRKNKERDRRRDEKRRSRTPELNEDERDRRTVFVQQLAARLRSKELIAFFEKVGPVKEAQIVKDRISGRSKGVGYVEFKNEESVPLAIQLTGQKLLGIPIIAQLTEAEKNRLARSNEAAAATAHGVPFHRLYVGNIHFSITEGDLENVFDPFGELEFVQLQKEDNGRSRGYGFVQYRNAADAKEALEKMNGFDLAGRPIRVGLGNDKFTSESTANLLQRFPGGQQPQNSSSGRSHQTNATFDRAGGRDEKGASHTGALDDTDVGGVNFSNYSRDALMRKLARADEPAETNGRDEKRPMPQPRTENKPLAVNVPQASRCVVLRNMFDPTQEEGDDWVKDLEGEVKAECEDKYGKVVHLAVDPNTQGDIYVKFERVQGGENAIKGLNGRFFAGQMISAQPVVDAVYSSLFNRTKAL